MRLKSGIYVSALMRRAFAAGGFAAVENKGADEAGAIFIRTRGRDGLETLYGPAPQSFFDEGEAAAGKRIFEIRLEGVAGSDIDALLQKEKRYDPDLWIIELEMSDVSSLIDLAE